jgi:hypothetical protein
MKKQEIEFLEKNILNLASDNNAIKIEFILDYLDYINKVRYEKKEIFPILEKLVAEQKLNFVNNEYSLNRKLLLE